MSIFGGGPNFFTIPQSETRIFNIQKVEKYLKEHVADREREREALQLFVEAKKEIKVLEKKLKESGKHFRKLQSKKETNTEELKNVFYQSEELRKKSQLVLVEKRLRLRQLLKADEWDSLLLAGQNHMAENPKKGEKVRTRIQKSEAKILNKTRKLLQKQFEEKEKLSIAMDAFGRFEAKVERYTEESIGYISKNNTAAEKYRTNQSTLENVFTALNNSREEAMIGFLEMREELKTISTNKEWKKISKALNKLL